MNNPHHQPDSLETLVETVQTRQLANRIAAAERAANRPAGSVTLIAVSKVQPLDRVVDVLEAGHRVFGENYVQEAAGKWPDLRGRFDYGSLSTADAQAAKRFAILVTSPEDGAAIREADAPGR